MHDGFVAVDVTSVQPPHILDGSDNPFPFVPSISLESRERHVECFSVSENSVNSTFDFIPQKYGTSQYPIHVLHEDSPFLDGLPLVVTHASQVRTSAVSHNCFMFR